MRKEAAVIVAKCPTNHKLYGIRVEHTGNREWTFTWSFPIKEQTAQREGYDKTKVVGNLLIGEEYPGCPYRKQKVITICECGQASCTHLRNNVFTCEWCNSKGELSGSIPKVCSFPAFLFSGHAGAERHRLLGQQSFFQEQILSILYLWIKHKVCTVRDQFGHR